MAKIRGRYINLASSVDRRKILTENLVNMGCQHAYTRFNAFEGDENEGDRKGLSKGEHGIWKSWIELLKQEEKVKQKHDYDYLHIVEDDVVISREFLKFADELPKERLKAEIIVTDMYTNISVYKELKKTVYENIRKKDERYRLLDAYTGCLSSCLLHRNTISNLLHKLEKEFKTSSELIPLDNYLRRESLKKEIRIYCTLPYLTSVHISSISESTIQNRQKEPRAILISQNYCTYLRIKLSVYRDSIKTSDFIEAISSLMREIKNDQRQSTEIEVDIFNDFMQKEKVLRFKPDERLKNEEDNEQSSLFK